MNTPHPPSPEIAYRAYQGSRLQLQQLIARGLARPDESPNSEFISVFMGDLLRELSRHFECEEQFLAASACPELAVHRAIHFNLMEELVEICFRLALGDKQAARGLQAFLRQNLREHLAVDDEIAGDGH